MLLYVLFFPSFFFLSRIPFFGSALVRMIWDVARYLSLQLEDWNVIMGMDKVDGLERSIKYFGIGVHV